MTGVVVTTIWPSGHGVTPATGGVCWRWVLQVGMGHAAKGPSPRFALARLQVGSPTERYRRIGRGSKLRIAAVSTGAGDGTGGSGGRQFTNAPDDGSTAGEE